jgi:hypothetical protein
VGYSRADFVPVNSQRVFAPRIYTSVVIFFHLLPGEITAASPEAGNGFN